MGTLSITTNTSALNVQRNLSEANDRSASSLAKLSSGSRVPTARDDAASLAIGSRLEAEVAGLNQASINASQATSMLQIADGALSEINDVLVRLKSLSVQSASGQLSDTERGLLDSEFQQLLSEIDRISEDTEFNGNQLLNGGDIISSTNELSTGALDGAGMSISYDPLKVTGAQDTDGDGNFDIQGDTFSVQYDGTDEKLTLTNLNTGEKVEQDIRAALTAATGGAAADLAPGQTLDVTFADMGITITLDDDFARATDFNDGLNPTTTTGTPPTYTNLTATAGDSGIDSATLVALQAAGAFDATTGNINLTVADDGAGVVTIDGAGLEFSVGGGAFGAGPTADLDDAAAKTIEVRVAGSTDVLFTLNADTIASAGNNTSTLSIPMNNVFGAQEDVQNTSTFSYQVGTGTTASDTISVTVTGANTTSLGINATNISTQANAQAAIDQVGDAIDTLQNVRAQVGASLSRLDFASSNLSVTIENSEAAKSGLLDVDVATETTKYTAEQVIVQAGVSLLAQANQRPNTLLSLLQQ
jgi:flagellin